MKSRSVANSNHNTRIAIIFVVQFRKKKKSTDLPDIGDSSPYLMLP